MTTTDPAPPLISDPDEVASIAGEIARAGSFSLDLEFMTEGRYLAELSLVQVGWGDPSMPKVAAIDPLSVDARPVVTLVGDPSVTTVIHSAQADLALIGAAFHVRGRNVVDTQIGAAFLGLGDQIGYGALIEHTSGIRLDKGAQFTEWSRRPLSDEQIRYALDDVRYLPEAWRQLQGDLRTRGRLDWVMEECDRLAETWAERVPPEEMYRRVRGWNALRPRSQGALRALAAWREEESLRANRPPSWLVNDRTMLEIARRPPDSVDELRAVRGLGEGTAQRYGEAIIAAARRGMDNPPDTEAPPPRLPNRGQSWPAVLSGIVQARCREASIASRFVATRREIDDVIAWWLVGDHSSEPDLPLLSGWRRELVGDDILEWLRGETAVVVDPDTEAGLSIRR
ncbi:MAG: HRDC domain-containing protein [Chloroflexi bacterium]|nr:HRDC domain-containing protein [Chloroflexota bacterium]MDA1239828.1 HRDC domain-containing protein [Chloroflexota bacterium]